MRPTPQRVGRSTGARLGGRDRDGLVLAAGAGFLGLSWLIWVGGGLLTLVTTGRWREVPVGNAPALLVRLMAHPFMPREAWPPLIRRSLPGTGLTLAWLTGLVVAAVVSSAAIWWSAVRPRRARARSSPGARGWAHARDLRRLRVRSPTGDRIVLGTNAGHLLAAEPRHSVMVVGPTQSGKTTALAIPAILEWEGPLLATSVKADLLRETLEWRRSIGQVQCYDPTGSTGAGGSSAPPSPGAFAGAVGGTAGWSPLARAVTWPGARRIASSLCSVARAGDGGMEDAGFWYANAEKLLAPLLFAAATAGASMADVVRWLDEEETAEVLLALELAGVPEAVRAARASLGREERQRASVYATAETVVAAFADPAVAASAERCDIDPAALVASHAGSLFCCAPAREQERLAPVFTAIVREVLDAAFERAAATGRPLDPPLLVVLDEAASVAPLADLDRVVATAAGHGVQLVTVWQDLAQVESRYGTRWATVVNNHRAKIVCSGIADPVTLQHVSGLLGDEERADRSWTVGDDGRHSRTEAVSVQALAPAGWLRQLPPGEAVLVYGSLPPAQIALRPWFDDPGLTVRAGGGSAR
ncbi:MAG TPA: type IV secretory system conjugative DNA transfer family protein [Mycobacteriales bacterium]|nr:type IV secretory system conjugative DNA transfer family protein [Mycobacteriales bacterium]